MVSAHHSGTHPLKPWKGHTKHCYTLATLRWRKRWQNTWFQNVTPTVIRSNRGRVTPKLANLILQTSDNLSMQHRCASGVLPQHSLRASGRSLCMFRLYMSSGTCTRSVSAWACIRSAATWRWSSLSWASALCRSSWSSLLCLSSWRLRAALCLFSWRLTAALLSPSFNWEW